MDLFTLTALFISQPSTLTLQAYQPGAVDPQPDPQQPEPSTT
jgi:hypothetical protein